jgi:hypothetical protein
VAAAWGTVWPAIAAGGGGSNRNLQRVKNWDNPLASVVHFGLLFDFSVII